MYMYFSTRQKVWYHLLATCMCGIYLNQNPLSHIGDKPTLLQLVNMKWVDGKPLDVIGWIAANYYTFGMNLLQDENGVKVDVIKRNHTLEGAEAITQEIVKKWLSDGGSRCTYLHLVECLRKSGLGTLADEISGQLERKEVHESVSRYRSCSQ